MKESTLPVSNPGRVDEQVLDEFRKAVRGGVRADPVTRHAYSTDASMYKYVPEVVIEPLDREDMLSTIRICARFKLPLLARGGGTSLVGQSIGSSVVMDVSRHCNRILEFNPEERWIRVEPGMVRDELNKFLKPHGLHFAPDPATTSRANIGGMIANNSSGMRSIQYGMTIDHVLGIDLALADGEVISLGPVDGVDMNHDPRDRSELLQQSVMRIIDRERQEIIERYPKVSRRSGGYPLDAFVSPPPWNFAKLIAGSEGTLGVITEARLNLEPLPAHSGLCLAHFKTLGECLRAVKPIVDFAPSAVELIDGLIIRRAREHTMTKATCAIIEDEPEGLLVIEVRSDDASEVQDRLGRIQSMLETSGMGYAAPVMLNPEDVKAVWDMRESALGLMSTVKGNIKPVPYIEDAAVPLDSLPDYVEEVLAVCEKYERTVSLFAHAGAGLLHIRPMHDLHKPEDVKLMLRIQDEVFDLVKRYGGSWSGEHGDGIIRGGYNRAFFGDRIYQAFVEIKDLFDPDGLINPGKVVNTPQRDKHLRLAGGSQPVPVQTGYRWIEDGTLMRASEQCTGIGACRRISSGVMCPSYMATRDEIHSTRGRANTLRQALSGELGRDALSRKDVMAVFDLCLSCKGCKGECPNKVDVGKMKAELQYQYYKQHRRPLRDRIFANAALLGRFHAGWHAPLANALLEARPLRFLLDRMMGIDARRPLPRYASRRFSTWFRKRNGSVAHGRKVVLFNDIYSEYHEPELGRAAVRVLEAFGYQVELFNNADSRRPALSLGMLDHAKRGGNKLFSRLSVPAKQGCPILVLEPSCATALLQDLPDLVDDTDMAQTVASNVFLLDSFLADEIDAGKCVCPEMNGSSMTIFHHPHCHQKSIDQGRGTASLLNRITDANIIISPAGCCGMAGSFGYEKEHYDLSVKVAEDRLLPSLKGLQDDAIVVSTGFSCRHQISDLTRRRVIHPVQLMDGLINKEESDI